MKRTQIIKGLLIGVLLLLLVMLCMQLGQVDAVRAAYHGLIGSKETDEQTEPPLTTEEKPTAAQTEAETEPATMAPDSLLYRSNGNGTCTVAGRGTCSSPCIVIPTVSPTGETVTAVGERAFYEDASVRMVEIPATVTVIGDAAFTGCAGLLYISVQEENRYFRDEDGVLFTEDGATLLCYPSAHSGDTLSLPVRVTAIAPMAFCNCKNLTTVAYGGTESQWDSVEKGAGNYSLWSAVVIFRADEKST